MVSLRLEAVGDPRRMWFGGRLTREEVADSAEPLSTRTEADGACGLERCKFPSNKSRNLVRWPIINWH